jgi:hypothetical protein
MRKKYLSCLSQYSIWISLSKIEAELRRCFNFPPFTKTSDVGALHIHRSCTHTTQVAVEAHWDVEAKSHASSGLSSKRGVRNSSRLSQTGKQPMSRNCYWQHAKAIVGLGEESPCQGPESWLVDRSHFLHWLTNHRCGLRIHLYQVCISRFSVYFANVLHWWQLRHFEPHDRMING